MQGKSGRRHGENTEHIWAMMKPLFKLSRYMTPANRLDMFECTLELIASVKQERFVHHLTSRGEYVMKLLAQCRADIEVLQEEAADPDMGVLDLKAARDFWLASQNDDAAQEVSVKALIAIAKLKVEALKSKLKVGAPNSLLNSTSSGLAQHAKQNEGALRKAIRDLGNVAVKLTKHPFNMSHAQMESVVAMKSSDPGFEEYITAAREEKSSEMAAKVEEQVFKYRLLERQKEVEPSGQNSTKMAKAILAARTRARNMLTVYADWAVYGTNTPKEEVTDDLLSRVMAGKSS